MSKVALAAVAHPDDIEFMMAGTLLLLGQAGYELHYLNIANGSCGSTTMTADEIAAIRTQEAQAAADALGATYHQPLVSDLMIYYTPELAARLGALVRRIDPQIVLLQSPQDYMEDHMNAARLMVTATFCRAMPNFPTQPPTAPVQGQAAVYHAMPYGLAGPLREPIQPHFYVDITSVLDRKREALACHHSQKEWLDKSQGLDSYLRTMEEMSAEVGRRAGGVEFAEGWRRRSHLGFGEKAFDPLSEALSEYVRPVEN